VVVRIFEQLVKKDLGEDMLDFDFLSRLDLNEDIYIYIMALRSTLKKPVVFLKKNVIDI
jgi:hypothetical protein